MKPGEPLDPSGLEVLVIFVHLYHTMSNPYVSHRWDMCLWHEKKTVTKVTGTLRWVFRAKKTVS